LNFSDEYVSPWEEERRTPPQTAALQKEHSTLNPVSTQLHPPNPVSTSKFNPHAAGIRVSTSLDPRLPTLNHYPIQSRSPTRSVQSVQLPTTPIQPRSPTTIRPPIQLSTTKAHAAKKQKPIDERLFTCFFEEKGDLLRLVLSKLDFKELENCREEWTEEVDSYSGHTSIQPAHAGSSPASSQPRLLNRFHLPQTVVLYKE
jgi:hypothetical protein